MIWSGGKILPDDGLSISVLDRTFEHGLGLFETLRTWGGRPTLLDRHNARMLRSAAELELPIDPASLPQELDVRMLLDAEAVEGDRMLRITATGGTSTTPSVVWMKSAPLPEPVGEGGARLLVASWTANHDDLARHKTLNYWRRRRVFEEAKRRGYDEGLSSHRSDKTYYYEGSRTNLFIILNRGLKIGTLGKRRPVLVTTATTAPIVPRFLRGIAIGTQPAPPIVPGIMREIVIEIAAELGLEVDAGKSGIDSFSFGRAREIFLTNSVRGIIPVRRAAFTQPPTPWTRRLQEALARRLYHGPS